MSQGPFVCATCSARFDSFAEFINHLSTHGEPITIDETFEETEPTIELCSECGGELNAKGDCPIEADHKARKEDT